MPLVATLITDPSNPILSPELANRAANGVSAQVADWLAQDISCDLVLKDGVSRDDAQTAIADALDGEPVDIVIQETADRKKSLLIADMDSTMIRQECVDELAAEAGVYEHVAAITKRAMNGEIEFESAMCERVALLEGLDLTIVHQVLKNRITLTRGGKTALATMKANGAYTALVSGGFTLFTDPISEIIGFDEHRANVLGHRDGKLDGTVIEPVLGGQSKVDALNELTAAHGLSVDQAMAVGDGANDLGMLKLAGSGVALHAKPVVAAEAKIRIDHGDLTALLYVQGYRKDDFAGVRE
ncbi:MAG: phosphoserine phosphatase SerB [Hyphomicrobiales bacterium]|nr:phosphoserine phosphatase SerB [Hyphomicrobiales bacterium]MCP4999489.1 phosphoserine phosphatase SerB [Hyphomicrobiales bacterium]